MTDHEVRSPCGRFVFLSTRRWEKGKRLACWILLAPTTERAMVLDRCQRHSLADFDAMAAVYLYPRVAPALDLDLELLSNRHEDRIARLDADVISLRYLRWSISDSVAVVCAWGESPAAARRGPMALNLAAGGRILALGTTRDGSPRSPLHAPRSQPLARFEPHGAGR